MSMQESHEHPHELRLDLPAAHSAERLARAVMRQFAQREGVPKREMDSLEFVASELMSNAVDHGGGQGTMEESDLPSRVRMQLVLKIAPDGWEMRVSDQGGGDPENVRSVVEEQGLPDLEDERGRGFFLLKQMLERLSVVKSEDGLGLCFVTVRRYEPPR